MPQRSSAIGELIAELGPIDVLINNAANDDRHDIGDVTEEYWENRVNVNLKHFFFCAQSVIPSMRSRGSGAIINLGSISWHLALPQLTLYQMCKAAIEGLTRSLARELGPDNIRVTCVVPGNVRTPRQQSWYTPEGEAEIVSAQCLKDRLEPRDIAAMVLFLASDDARLVHRPRIFRGRRLAMTEPRSVWDVAAALGEGPVWVERDRGLWFTDVEGPRGRALRSGGAALGRPGSRPEQVGFVLPARDGGFIAGLMSGLHRFETNRPERFTLIAEIEAGAAEQPPQRRRRRYRPG